MADRERLDRYLARPRCTSCGIGRMRPINLIRGDFLLFKCSNIRCHLTAHVELPPIRKKIVYLDTSIVSSMARARARADRESPYYKLYLALKMAVAANLIVCPGSTIVEVEAEMMTTLADIIIEMAKELGDPGLNHELYVKEAQLARALKRYLAGEAPMMEMPLPESDALIDRVHVWNGVLFPVVDIRTPPELVAATRSGKAETVTKTAVRYQRYADAGLTFEDIVKIERNTFGVKLLTDGLTIINAKKAVLEGRIDDPRVQQVLLLVPTLTKLAFSIEHELKCSEPDSYTNATEFLLSDHAAETAYSHISSRLNAELAMRCRGNAKVNPRLPQPSDAFDVEHMATFMPYVDVFVADNFMAAIANHNHLNLGQQFDTEIRSLRQADIPNFTDWLEALEQEGEIADLSKRINASISEGEFYDDFARSVS